MLESEKVPKNSELLETNLNGLSKRERERMIDSLATWLTRVKNPENNIQQDGAYETQSNNLAEPIKLFHYSYVSNASQREVLLILAIDKRQRLLGMRHTTIDDHTQELVATGNINVLKRGEGIASSIEALHFNLLQDRINNDAYHKTLEYSVTDINQRRIDSSRYRLQQAIDAKNDQAVEDEKPHLEQVVYQRNAWLKLYGPEGKLGFQKEQRSLVKRFIKGNPKKISELIEIPDTLDLPKTLSAAIEKLEDDPTQTW